MTSAVHGAVLWAAITSWSGSAQTWVEPPAVTLVAIRGGPAPEDDGAVQPAAEPDKPKPVEPVEKSITEPAPAKPTPISPEPTPIPAPQPVPAPAQAAFTPVRSPAPATPAPAAKPAPPAPPQRAGEVAGLDVNAPRGKSQDYAAMLRVWLEAHKTYPRHAKMRREEGVVQIRFAVDRSGRLLEGAIVHSSGVSSLDKEALAMLDRSNPFPAAPNTVRGERIELQTPVEFYLR